MGHWGKKGRGYAGNAWKWVPKYIPSPEENLQTVVIETDRVTRVTKGGKRSSYRAFVVVGNGKGAAGWGMGKALEPAEAIRKAENAARKNMYLFPIVKGTIPHEVEGRFKAARIILKPASPGTGVIAGWASKALFEVMGIRDILSKSLGSSNPINVIKATFDALSKLRTLSFQAKLRGKKFTEIMVEPPELKKQKEEQQQPEA